MRVEDPGSPDWYVDINASVTSVTEGGDIELTISASVTDPGCDPSCAVTVYYSLAPPFSADPSDYTVNSESVQVELGGEENGLGYLPTFDDSLPELTESFEVHVWLESYPESVFILEADIFDNDVTTFTAEAMPAVVGEEVLLYGSQVGPGELEYLVEEVSAQVGIDYTDPGASGGTNWVPIDASGLVSFGTIENSLDEAIRSFRDRVRVIGYPESEVVVEADILDDDLPGVIQTVDYAYDPFDQLIRRTLDADGQGPAAATDTFYSWQDGQIVGEFAGSDFEDLSHRYLYGPAVDQLLADEAVDDLLSPGDVLWPLADHLNTARDLVEYDAATNETTIANHRVYDSFGNLVSETNASVDLLFGFTGGLYDSATHFTYRLHRWCDAKTGQWLSEDPITFTAGDPNLRRYVSNNPFSFIDPSGLIGNGHHFVNQANWGGVSQGVRDVFDADNARIFNDWYKGHNYEKVNGHTHGKYNAAVKNALDDFLNGRDPATMTPKEAKSFLERIKCSSDPIISQFNDGVRAEANAAAKAGKQAADAATRAGKGADGAKKAGINDARKAVQRTRQSLNDAAAKRAQKAAAKRGGKSIGKRLWQRIPVISGLISGAATWWNTGDVNAAGREVFLDASGFEYSRDAAELAAEGYDFAERDRDASAQSVRDNFWRTP